MVSEQFEFDFNAPLAGLPQLWTPDDIFNTLDGPTLLRFKEDNRVERKRVEVSQRDLADYLSMWANTQPHGGIVFIGIENAGKITGCAHADVTHINDLEQVRRLCSDARIDFKRIPVRNHSKRPAHPMWRVLI